MSFFNKTIFVLLVVFSTLACNVSAADKVIVAGWDEPTPSQWHAHLSEVEKKAYFTGYVIRPTRIVNNAEVLSYEVFSNQVWTWDQFQPIVANFAVKSTLVKDNFLLVGANPGADFYDDVAWKNIVDHWRLLARLAKQGELEGLVFDPESYTPTFNQFYYDSQTGKTSHSYQEYRQKARQRGVEIMQAVSQEYPNIVIFSYRLFSRFLPYSPAKVATLNSDAYGLYPDFLGGMFEASVPQVQFIEGDEESYVYNSRDRFEESYVALKTNVLGFLNADNQIFWKNQVKVGHGIYMDPYFLPSGAPHSIDKKGLTIGQRLAMNLVGALNASDGWVFVDGEQGAWWTANSKSVPWLDKNGGVDYLRSLFVDGTVNTNNKIIDSNTTYLSKDWRPYIDHTNGVNNQCFYQQRNISGDELFAVHMLVGGVDSNNFYSIVQWGNSGKLYPYSDVIPAKASQDGFINYSRLVRAPEKATSLRLLICSKGGNMSDGLSIQNLYVAKLLP